MILGSELRLNHWKRYPNNQPPTTFHSALFRAGLLELQVLLQNCMNCEYISVIPATERTSAWTILQYDKHHMTGSGL